MTGGACPCVSAGGAHFKGPFCEVKLLLLIYNENVICNCLSSDFLYLFTWRATKYQRKDTRFQSFKLILAFQFINQLFYCRAKRKGCPRGKYHVSLYYHAKS